MTGAGRLRMLHWNIHSWRDDAGAPNYAAVAGLIRETAPDVVSLVEVRESWGAPSAWEEPGAGCPGVAPGQAYGTFRHFLA